ncbi:MAG: hypothetical protein GY856_14635, partial [bacterium]|nr:hypothetical protein [bacterium]
GASDVGTATYGSEGGDNQSLTLDPDVLGTAYVKHTLATGSGGALYSPGTRIDGGSFVGCPVGTFEIFAIQGSSTATPYDGQTVITLDNVVTAVGPEGFFIQTPDARDDLDPDTSNGVYVYTETAPSVAVGDQVDVSGVVIEYYDFTEFGNSPVVTVDSSGNPLPAMVTFDVTRPSPDPTAPSCAIEYECYEGMLVTVTGGRVCGPNQRFGVDPIAEIHVTAAPTRCLREPGVAYPGIGGGIPTWDGNPEVFELDPNGLGLPNQVVPAGSTFNVTGALAYEYGDYEIWPTSFAYVPVTLPLPVRDAGVEEFTVGSLNLWRLFDHVGNADVSEEEYNRRLAKFSIYIRDVLKSPDILGVQEAEKIGVLNALAAEIVADDATVVYTAYLVEGNDIGGIDVGFLVRDTVSVTSVTQLGAGEMFSFPGHSDIPLHDRPPLLLEASYIGGATPFAIAVMVNHTRSLIGIDDPDPDGAFVRQKRFEQAQSIAQKVQDFQTADPTTPLVLVGDFNAFQFTDGYVDVVGQIAGDFDPSENLLSGPDLVSLDLTNEVLRRPLRQRYSFIQYGNAQVLDHALTSAAFFSLVNGFDYGRGNADAAIDWINDETTALRSSDHDGLVLYICTAPGCVPVELQSFTIE